MYCSHLKYILSFVVLLLAATACVNSEKQQEVPEIIPDVNVGVFTSLDSIVIAEKAKELDKKFSITHIGLMNADRNPKILWKALSEIMNENSEFTKDLEIKFIGEVADEVKKYIADHKLEENTKYITYVPHQKVIVYQTMTQVLLLAVNNVPSAKGIITGKIFEYLQAKRPIIAIAPLNGDLAEIINKTNAGFVVEFEDKENLKKTILDLYKKYKDGELKIVSKNIDQYHRKELTQRLTEIIKNI